MRLLKTIGVASAILAGGVALSMSHANATKIKIEITNLSATGGLYSTPYWLSFHDGTFNTFTAGSAASVGLERFAEDGNAAPLRADFAANANMGSQDTMLTSPGGFSGAPLFDPGETATTMLSIDRLASGYFSFLSMLLPSNDAFIGNSTAFSLFDGMGNFQGLDFTVMGSMVYDAGTEHNTEHDVPFLNQMGPNTGITENGVVALHGGFLTSGGHIFGATTPAGTMITQSAADFTQSGFQVARIRITQVTSDVPEPAALGLLALGLFGMAAMRRRKQASSDDKMMTAAL